MLKISLTFVLTTLIAITVFAAKGKTPSAVFIDNPNIKWSEVPGFKGVQIATVEGDSAKGAHHSFMKFEPGFSAPLHHHSADHFATVVSGTLVLTANGKEQTLPAGSYFSFKNKEAHTTACAKGAECVLFIDVRGKWDIVPEKN